MSAMCPGRTLRLASPVALLTLLSSASAAALPPGRDGQAVREAAAAIAELRVEEAARLAAPVARRHPDDADVLATRALIHLHQGDYAEAAAAMERAIARGPTSRELAQRRELLELMEATRDATAGFVQATSPDGRFIVRHAPGPDAVLVPWALDALAAADTVLAADLGHRIPGPVRLEIYPTAASLARVSALSVADIERTGTIALCKWDRLMITSPRALVRGYPWMDTIGHEYVHLVLARASRDRAPVWFQEGVARFLEQRWRGDAPASHVEPAVEALLSRALATDALIPFERLHPSIARLPSQEDAALAFAQVATFIESFQRRHGAAGLREAVGRIAAGEDARRALAGVAAEPFPRLLVRWREDLASRPRPDAHPPRLLGLRFRHGEGSSDEAREVEQENARRFLRLGDLLWGRARAAAAAAEYEKAHRAAPDDPIVASRFGRAALAAGNGAAAIGALRRIRERYPEHAPAHAVLGSALASAGRYSDALPALRAAIGINPFDPQPHCDLARAGADDAERRRGAEACRLLGGRL